MLTKGAAVGLAFFRLKNQADSHDSIALVADAGAGRKLELGDIGWHTFRHTYRSWLDLVGTTIGVQQKLMRHAQIATTMNVYGNARMESKREANSKVVQMALRQEVR